MYKWFVYITLYKWFVCLMSWKLFDVLWLLILFSSDYYNKHDLYLIWSSFNLSKPNAGVFISIIFYINGPFYQFYANVLYLCFIFSLLNIIFQNLWNISNNENRTRYKKYLCIPFQNVRKVNSVLPQLFQTYYLKNVKHYKWHGTIFDFLMILH